MSAKESQEWKENIAAGALKGSKENGEWILNSTATSEA
jgi:hypothetical protein